MFDTARAYPSQQIEWATCLVIGARGTRPSEGLLRDNCTGWLVVDVEVSSGEPKGIECRLDVLIIVRKNLTGQCVGAGLITYLKGLFELVIIIQEHRQYRAKNFLYHRLIIWVTGHDNRRFNEPTHAVI